MISMKLFYKNFIYIWEHRWYVFVECCRLGIPWRGILHDLSKYYPGEYISYARHFYSGKNEQKRYSKEFTISWLRHIHRNPHHWQYWIHVQKAADLSNPYLAVVKAFEIPDKYLKEMIADWRAMGRTGLSARDFYSTKRYDIILHKKTRKKIEKMLGV